jgi:hypothetical protein
MRKRLVDLRFAKSRPVNMDCQNMEDIYVNKDHPEKIDRMIIL